MKHDVNQDNQGIQPTQHEAGQSADTKEGGGQKPPLSLWQAALDYAKDGWAVLPLHSAAHGTCSCGIDACESPGKHPRTPHGYKDATTDASIINQWWTKWQDANIGLVTGKVSGRVVVDVDVKKGKQGDQELQTLIQKHHLWPETLKALTPTGGDHFVFQAPKGTMGSPINVRPGIDILTDGRYIVAAPSMINDQAYQWIVRVPAAVCPQWVVDLANEAKSTKVTSNTDVATVVKALFPQGQERNGEWHMLCPFHDEQNPSFSVNLKEGIYHCFACSAKGNLVDLYVHVKGVTPAVARQALGQTPNCIVELNNKHAVVSVGGKCVILTETLSPEFNQRDIALSSPTDLKLKYANRKERVGKSLKPKPIMDLWLEHPERREYESIVFAPNRKVPGHFNLWQGFAVEPKEGDCSLYLAHLKDNIAKGNPAIYDYVVSWMAQMIQHPDQRVGVSLVLRGKQGTGKGAMCTHLGGLLGKHFVHVQHRSQLLGHFNAHLKHGLLVFSDEAFWAGDKASEGALKAMVTEKQLPIEYKGKDVIYVKNHIHLLVASNHDWVIPAGLEERRFCVLDVGEDHLQDTTYFGDLEKQMQNGGLEALLYELQHYDLTGKNLRKFPQTEALLENKLLTMTPVQKFWQQRLIWGALTEKENQWVQWVLRKRLHDEYREYIEDLGQSRKSTETELGLGLKKLVPGLRPTTRLVSKKRVQVWEFPDLATCRQEFDKALNYTFDWENKGLEDGTGPPTP